MPHVLVQYPVYMQRVVVVHSARIFLAERQEDPSTIMYTAFARKNLVLGVNQIKMAVGRSVK